MSSGGIARFARKPGSAPEGVQERPATAKPTASSVSFGANSTWEYAAETENEAGFFDCFDTSWGCGANDSGDIFLPVALEDKAETEVSTPTSSWQHRERDITNRSNAFLTTKRTKPRRRMLQKELELWGSRLESPVFSACQLLSR
jgi:hypothetical protein